MPHPPYSPNLAPSELFLFVFLDEKLLKGKCLDGVEEVKQKMTEPRKGIKIDKFKNCFEQWENVSISVLHQM